MDERPLSQIVEAIESGQPLAPDEAALIERAAVHIAMPSADEHRAQRASLIREIVKRFGPRTASVNARVEWLQVRQNIFVGGADWRHAAKNCVVPPFSDAMRALQWRLAKLGPLPRTRLLSDILSR